SRGSRRHGGGTDDGYGFRARRARASRDHQAPEDEDGRPDYLQLRIWGNWGVHPPPRAARYRLTARIWASPSRLWMIFWMPRGIRRGWGRPRGKMPAAANRRSSPSWGQKGHVRKRRHWRRRPRVTLICSTKGP